ncbi:hypothetical protein BX616_007252 [Lobosporangium transversale]|uniref:FAD-binding domain-containing protein n=1 Tax=Lobosporangium transversale TaxID=64571 RepID=A0A1Y2GKC1_9FUNG|nr:hypothetical protein BCR41DRAFT_357148 [Lobosporangium transversale]KAF9914948.1 hypothetical protein BX616_007252 [Lobosporangium transversale]ORZ11394.1 hypothetical protein BCR41DRAFT_357148 [Lobosporangium transversale]|eukprot:XP_021879709.1 hypothetical protein BCR41DRAFT_357148 [Lobosporangium transversale]
MSKEYFPSKPSSKPKVLIVGAGISGLTLAILLEKASIPYEVYDRMAQVRPLGSALSITANLAPLFKQIGIYDEFVSLGLPFYSIDNYNEDRTKDFIIDFKPAAKKEVYPGYIFPRTVFYDLLRRQVPSNKISLGKRVVSIKESLESVQIQFSDGTTAEGDILVGADGAYSTIRENLYRSLKSEGQLPVSDDEPLPFSCLCLVGQTNPMDPEKYPQLTSPVSLFRSVIGENKPYAWTYLTARNNIFCWGLIHYLDNEYSKDHEEFCNIEWGPGAAIDMCKEIRDFPVPGGKSNDMTLGDLIDNTPLVSKVLLEEKVFDTWYSGRTVLIGDACHKIHIASGVGAINGIMDAVALANWLSVLDSPSIDELTEAFKEYKAERYPAVKADYLHSRAFSKVTATGLVSKVIRCISRNFPVWLWNFCIKRWLEVRPQVSFLPLVDNIGTVPAKYQPSLQKTLELRRAKELQL